jgi:glycine/D-amino acid oxidase-like deaminating enzyme
VSTSVLDYAPTLDRDEKADFVVVGSGIAGLSVAYELSKAGQDVVVVDRGPVGKGMTSRTTAYLTAQCDDGFEQLVSRRGEEIARLWYQSQAACIDRIQANQAELGVASEFRRLDGYLFHAPGTDAGIIDREFEATRKIGMPVDRQKGVPFKGRVATHALRYPKQAPSIPSNIWLTLPNRSASRALLCGNDCDPRRGG